MLPTEGATLLGEVAKGHFEQDAYAVGVGDRGDRAFGISAVGVRALPISLLGELGGVDNTGRVVHDDGGIAAFLGSGLCQYADSSEMAS